MKMLMTIAYTCPDQLVKYHLSKINEYKKLLIDTYFNAYNSKPVYKM